MQPMPVPVSCLSGLTRQWPHWLLGECPRPAPRPLPHKAWQQDQHQQLLQELRGPRPRHQDPRQRPSKTIISPKPCLTNCSLIGVESGVRLQVGCRSACASPVSSPAPAHYFKCHELTSRGRSCWAGTSWPQDGRAAVALDGHAASPAMLPCSQGPRRSPVHV